MLRTAVFALGVGLLATSRAVGQLPDGRELMSEPACAGLTNTFRCARALEYRYLLGHPSEARRDADTLFLRLADGRFHAVIDEGPTHPAPLRDEWASYSLIGRLTQVPYYVLHAQYGEGNAFALVHARTGWVGLLEGWPMASPDGRWLLVAEDGYFNRIGVFLYELTGDSVRSVWQHEPATWIPGRVRWRSATAAEVDQAPDTDDPAQAGRVLGRLRLRFTDGAWGIEAQ